MCNVQSQPSSVAWRLEPLLAGFNIRKDLNDELDDSTK